MPGMTTKKLFYTDYDFTIKRASKSKWQSEWETTLQQLQAM